jgi:hypothetical protein
MSDLEIIYPRTTRDLVPFRGATTLESARTIFNQLDIVSTYEVEVGPGSSNMDVNHFKAMAERELCAEVRPMLMECVPDVIRAVKYATCVLTWNGCYSQVLTHARKDVLDVAVEALGGARPLLQASLSVLQSALRPMSGEYLFSRFAFPVKSPVMESFIQRYLREAVRYMRLSMDFT